MPDQELEKMDVILFPINISNAHWCLAAVYPKEKKIKFVSLSPLRCCDANALFVNSYNKLMKPVSPAYLCHMLCYNVGISI